MVLALAAATACERKPASDSPEGSALSTRAKAVGDMPDNPMLAVIPADTPYAWVSFQPFPFEVMQKVLSAAQPMFAKAISQVPAEDKDKVVRQDVLDVLEHFDFSAAEAQGFTRKARFAFYGLPYPVMRMEVADGAKVYAFIQKTAQRWQVPLPPAIDRAGGHYWMIDDPKVPVVIAVLAKELVFAIAPKDALDAQLATILGEQKPAKALTTAQFRAIAERDGFTGLSIGFADTARIAELAGKQLPSPGCGQAFGQLVKRVPRVALGYGDFSKQSMTFGMVVELGPEVLAEARSLVGKIAGLDQMIAARPAMGMAAALDIDKATVAARDVAAMIADLGTQCDLQELASNAQQAVAKLGKPLPPFVSGIHGGYVALTKYSKGPQGPNVQDVEGFGSLQVEQVGEVIKLAQMKLTTLDLPLDGKAHALPPGLAPMTIHLAASDHTIGFGLGKTSEAGAVKGLAGKPAPAPLFVMTADYSQLSTFLPDMPASNAPSREDMIKLLSVFGQLVMQVVVDDRGVVMWTSLEMK